MLQAVLEVVGHCPLEVLDAAGLSQDVTLVWVQLQRVVGLHLHQSAQELSTVLEVYPRFGRENTHTCRCEKDKPTNELIWSRRLNRNLTISSSM